MDFKRKLGRLKAMPGGVAPGLAGEPPTPLAPRPPDTAPAAAGPDEDRDARISRLRALIGEVSERHGRRRARGGDAPVRGPRPVPVGALQETPHGPLHVVSRRLDIDARHGHVPVAGACSLPAELVAKLALDPSLSATPLDRMLVLDTETTGLAGGTGTVPFLIGLSYFVDGVLHVEQLFLRNLGGEVPLLRRLAERIAAASCVVSYNGKSFDWPLLRSRFILNRVPAPELPPHLDLLHCARRIFKPRMGSVRLVEMEREVLGFEREGDIDGAAIPDLYMGYLRGGDPRVILPILEHNDMDVVALPALLSELCRHFAEVQAGADPRDHLAFARVAARAADPERALRFAEAAAGPDACDSAVAVDALSLIAGVERRRGQPGRAAEALLAAIGRAEDEEAVIRLHWALAKLYEHRLRDPVSALRHARHTEPLEGARAHGRRIGRLWRRLHAGA